MNAYTQFMTTGIFAILLLNACATAPNSAGHETTSHDSKTISATEDANYPFIQSSKQNAYRVSLKSNVTPLPLDKIHSWTLLLQSADGKTIDDAKIMVYGGMPAHKHGFPTNPQVTEKLGNGKYIVDGIKFSMPGQWEIWLDIAANGNKDKAIFTIDVS